MTPKVTEEQLKSLKLFSYYCMSHGSSEVDIDVYTDECEYDYMSEEAYSDDGTRIELYDAISDVLKNILDENDVYQETSDCDNRGTIKINIDCKERILSLNAWQFFVKQPTNDINMFLSQFRLPLWYLQSGHIQPSA